MRHLSLILIFILVTGTLFTSCKKHPDLVQKELRQLSHQVSSLQDSIRILKNNYRPPLAQLMNQIQLDHAKLWFGGSENNWALAYFEMQQIRETLGKAIDLETTRPEVQKIPMIYPSLDSIAESISLRRPDEFKRGYVLLTDACNSCHQATNVSFSVLTIPATPPVPDQDFKGPSH